MARKRRKRNRPATKAAGAALPPEHAAREIAQDTEAMTGVVETVQNIRDIDLHQETNPNDGPSDERMLRTVESNARLLEQLLEEVAGMRGQIVGSQIENVACALPSQASLENESPAHRRWQEEISECQDRITEYLDRIAELEQQNNELASRVANETVRHTVACADSGSSDALSWEDRKKMILQQMEDDSFDAEFFIASLPNATAEQPLDPLTHVEQLHHELARQSDELARRDEEIRELHCLLEQHSGTRDGDVAIGAAAIAQLVDSDELIQQERERLQLLQTQWEEKFRQGEIEASLERAKISRERSELAQKHAALEEQLEHHRRETRHVEESGTSSRRWLAKLGLADSGS